MPERRISAERHRLPGLVDRVHAGDVNAHGSDVERLKNRMRIKLADTHDRSGAGQLAGANHVFGCVTGNRTMLLVNGDEIEAAQPDKFGELSRGNVKKAADYGLASLQLGFSLVGF